MARRREIIDFCDELLDADSFGDYGPNGLQFPGADEVSKVVTGVSATLELLRGAAASGAQLALVHHGLFWDFHPRAIGSRMKARLAVLHEADLSVAGYHLPLDAHPEIGNNALLCERLGFPREHAFGDAKGSQIGAVGRAPAPMSIGELTSRVSELTGAEPLVFDRGPAEIRTLAAVSGAGSSSIDEAVDLGVDCFLTGEPAEHVMADVTESGIHFIAAGHYATETFGIRRLGELVADRFNIEHEFISLPNPV